MPIPPPAPPPALPTTDADIFAAALPATGRLLGCDLGTKTLGLALSDEGRRIASPLTTLQLAKFGTDAAALARLAAAQRIAGLVIGLPLALDLGAAPRAQAARQFAENLRGWRDAAGAMPFAALPIWLLDERFSTVAVERTLLAADLSRKRRGELVDKLAASYILQGALDRLANIAARARLENEMAAEDAGW